MVERMVNKINERYQEIYNAFIGWFLHAQNNYVAAHVILNFYQKNKKVYFDGLKGKEGRIKLSRKQHFQHAHLQLFRTYLMLSGFALENLLKGILVAREPTLTDKRVSKKIKHHKLEDLFKLVGIEIDETETTMIERLTESITWAGRYPIPLSKDDMVLRKRTLGYTAQGGYWEKAKDWPGDNELIEQLWRRLLTVVEKEPNIKPGSSPIF